MQYLFLPVDPESGAVRNTAKVPAIAKKKNGCPQIEAVSTHSPTRGAK